MRQALEADLKDRRGTENVDVVKHVTFLIVIPAALVALRNGFAEGHIMTEQAAEATGAGLTLTVGVLARKHIANAFRQAHKVLCTTRQQIKDSFSYHKSLCRYVKDGVGESGALLIKRLGQTMRAAGKRPVFRRQDRKNILKS